MEPRTSSRSTRPIVVTGGTGTLGRHVVARLHDAGRAVRVVSRGRRAMDDGPGIEAVTADLATGRGVDAALATPTSSSTSPAARRATT